MAQDSQTTDAPFQYNLNPKEELLQKSDPIALDIDDDKLVKVIDKRIDDSHKFFSKPEIDLFNRRKRNEKYLFGRQIDEKERQKKLKIYETRYLDNIIYEIESSLKPLAMSRLPDILVTPGTQGPEKEQAARDVSKVVDTENKRRQNRIALGIAFKHRPVYFTGVIKCVWVPERNDYIFKVVHPDYIEVDHTAQGNDGDEMTFIAETVPITVQECFVRFPEGKKDLIKELARDGIKPGEDGKFTEEQLASEIKIREVWFDWIKPVKGNNGEEDQENPSFEQVNGVIWKYRSAMLKKMKNPNFDWEGQEKIYIYEDPSDTTTRRELAETDLMDMMMTGVTPENMSREQVFRNYFEYPRKPYFFMGYDQWGKIPYDETSELEQNLRNQENHDDTGKRVIEKLKSRKKHIWSKEGGIQQKHIEKMDLDDPKQDMLVGGDVNKVHATVEPEVPTAQEFTFMDNARTRMYGVAGANAIRGEPQSDVATTNQIAREADYTRADDVVEDTINAACEWMAQWSLQMVKLRYTDYHFKKLLGVNGSTTFVRIKSDMIEDGMEVVIKASGTDKLRIKNQAMDMAKLQKIDLLSFYQDLGVDDPEGRTEKLMLQEANPAEYLVRFVKRMGDTPAQMATTLNGVPPPSAGGPPQPAPTPTNAQQPSANNTGVVPIEPPTQTPGSVPNSVI